jgi:hypothetical protein
MLDIEQPHRGASLSRLCSGLLCRCTRVQTWVEYGVLMSETKSCCLAMSITHKSSHYDCCHDSPSPQL